MSGKFVDFYAVLGVHSDASQKEIWDAYSYKKGNLTSSAGGGQRERLLDAAIAVLGDETKRLAYDFSGEGGTVSFDVHWTDLLPAEAPTVRAAPNAGQAGYPPEGSVIAGSSRTEPQAGSQPAGTGETIMAGMGPRMVQYDLSEQSKAADASDSFTLRTSARATENDYYQGGFSHPEPRVPYARRQPIRDDEVSPLSMILSRPTLALGGIYALSLSILWMIELPLGSALDLLYNTKVVSAFFAAANSKNFAVLWGMVFVLAFIFWWAEIFGVVYLTHIADSESRFADPRHRQWLFFGEIALFLIVSISSIGVGEIIGAIGSLSGLGGIAMTFSSWFLLFLPLLIASNTVGKTPLSSLICQLTLLLGHMIVVSVMSFMLTGHASISDYFAGGLFKFGYVTWWIVFVFCYKGYERLHGI